MSRIDTAMVLAAGRGTRMKPRPSDPPKPLVRVDDRALIDHVMARLVAAGIGKIVVNLHHKAEQIETHLAAVDVGAKVVLSHERDARLETGGGVRHALPLLGANPFLVCNTDILWDAADFLPALMADYDAARMDALLACVPPAAISGHDGGGDFDLHDDGRLARRTRPEDLVFTGIQVLAPQIFDDDLPSGAFSLNEVYDLAAGRGRLYGHAAAGRWMHVGTPQGRALAQAYFEERP